jgi:uncharacterized protein YbgA (DUF1722 family)/uncharacterized protein YbbK (DUF523 family)
MSEPTLRLGISTCLLGENIRYDGGHKLDRFLRDTLGQFVEWIPVCPESECGLPVPREAMRLTGDPENPRLVTNKSGTDHTERMLDWSGPALDRLEKMELCGFVFKKKSPSSALADAKIYDAKGSPSRKGPGLFTRQFLKRFPDLPVEDEGRLHDPGLRENFIERIFAYHRFRKLQSERKNPSELVDFHARHKYLLMAHSPDHLKTLGQVVARMKGREWDDLLSEYRRLFLEALGKKASRARNVNVLQHMAGYFKERTTADERQELVEVIEEYQKGLTPLIVPVTLIRHHVRKYDEPYLKGQYYLEPHPAELMLRNHV